MQTESEGDRLHATGGVTTTPIPINQRVIPLYLVCDESQVVEPYLDDLHAAIYELHRALVMDAQASEVVLMSLVTFSDTAQVVVPLSRVTDWVSIPGCRARGGARYSEVFDLLLTTINDDIDQLRAARLSVLRPLAIVVTAASPSDESGWRDAHGKLTNPRFGRRPVILSFGVPGADLQTLNAVATPIGSPAGPRVAQCPADPSMLGQLFSEVVERTIRDALNPSP